MSLSTLGAVLWLPILIGAVCCIRARLRDAAQSKAIQRVSDSLAYGEVWPIFDEPLVSHPSIYASEGEAHLG